MSNFEPSAPERKKIPEKISITVGSREEGQVLIREFWEAMSHDGRSVTLPTEDDVESWKELTEGDRTMLMHRVDFEAGFKPGEKREKVWKVIFMPNTGNSFSNEAVEWFQKKGLIS